ncbi:hypothetical protein SK128_004427 [Halocaridina rubra]|uniref:Uncharacterized protein n=1 Tax=Halocaridina rubra TaxID=373956 RepID=A0AAN8WQV3_HALRR
MTVFQEDEEVSGELSLSDKDTEIPIKEEMSEDADSRQDEEESSAEGKLGNEEAIRSFNRRRKLKSLRRSLVMKQIWDARRKGVYPQRTSDRDKRSYNPRGSRTRNRVRKDMQRPRKTPKPWDLPIDGPLRVKAQVPFCPVKGRIIEGLSEDTDLPSTSETDLLLATSEAAKESQNLHVSSIKLEAVSPANVEKEHKLSKRMSQKVKANDQREAPVKIHVKSLKENSVLNENAENTNSPVQMTSELYSDADFSLEEESTSTAVKQGHNVTPKCKKLKTENVSNCSELHAASESASEALFSFEKEVKRTLSRKWKSSASSNLKLTNTMQKIN